MKKLKFVIYICSYCCFETEYPKGAKSVILFCPKCHEEQQFVETKRRRDILSFSRTKKKYLTNKVSVAILFINHHHSPYCLIPLVN